MHEVLAPTFERVDQRGLFREVLNSGQWGTLIHGRMHRGAVIGNHYHKRTLLFLFLVSGSARIRTIHVETGEREDFILPSGRGVMLRVNESHALQFLEESDFIMLKSEHYDPADHDTFPLPVPE